MTTKTRARRKTYAQRIKAAREKRNLSQTAAAAKWGFHQQTLNLWENGETQPQGLYRAKLEQVLTRLEQEQLPKKAK